MNKQVAEMLKNHEYLHTDDHWLYGHDMPCSRHQALDCYCLAYFKEMRNSWVEVVTQDLVSGLKSQGVKSNAADVSAFLKKHILSASAGRSAFLNRN